METTSYCQSSASFCTPATMDSGDSVGPDGNFRGSDCPVARIFTFVPPTSTTRTFMSITPRSGHRARLDVTDVRGVFGDRPIARELSRRGHIEDDLAGPGVRRRVQLAELLVRFDERREVRQVHVVVAVREQRVDDRPEDAGLVAAEVVAADQVERRTCLRFVLIM